MNKIKLLLVAIMFLLNLSWASELWAQDKKQFSSIQVSIPVQVKIVINENGKEIKSYLYDFHAANGQREFYKNSVTLPYNEKNKPVDEVRWIDLKNELEVTPLKDDGKIIVNSKILMSVDLASADSTLPVIGHFDYAGVSIHNDAEFLKVFSGSLKGLSHTVDIYIKTDGNT